jgi:hypothetical protein
MPKSDCREELQLLFDAAESFVEPALALPEPVVPTLEPRGCPTPGACSCPTMPTVPPELIRALELAEAALADIGDAEREPGDDLAWAEARAAQHLPRIRAVLTRWGRPAIEPVAVSERFEFSVFDSEYEEQAGGTAPTYSQALSEGQHCLAMYSQDGPHSLEIRRVEVLSHHALPVPGAEVGEPSASDIEDYNKRATARFQQMDALERHIDFNQVGWNQTDAGIKWQRLMNEQGADEMSMGL